MDKSSSYEQAQLRRITQALEAAQAEEALKDKWGRMVLGRDELIVTSNTLTN